MPIPASQPHDVLLAYLLRCNPEQLGAWLPLEDVADRLVPFFADKHSPGFVFNPHPPRVPSALLRAVVGLQRRLYLDYDDATGKIRLTPLGTFVAVLHELPPELADELRTRAV